MPRMKVLHTERAGKRDGAMAGKVSRKAKKRVFSIVKAVKANARARVGMPPAEKVLPDPKARALRKPRHKETLEDLLGGTEQFGG